jgi:hypothetical protein
MPVRDKFKEVQIPAYAPVPDRNTPQQRRYEEIANERGLTKPTWEQSQDIMQKVREEQYGGYKPSNGRLPSDRSFDF